MAIITIRMDAFLYCEIISTMQANVFMLPVTVCKETDTDWRFADKLFEIIIASVTTEWCVPSTVLHHPHLMHSLCIHLYQRVCYEAHSAVNVRRSATCMYAEVSYGAARERGEEQGRKYTADKNGHEKTTTKKGHQNFRQKRGHV